MQELLNSTPKLDDFPPKLRASAIIVKEGKILLVHRKKEGKEYWVFQGGGIEEGEKPEKTVRREVEREKPA